MKLRIKPAKENSYPLGGFLIKSPSVQVWVEELQSLSFTLQDVQVYPLPGTVAKSVWGCFVAVHGELTADMVGKKELCQRVFPNFYIPEKTKLTPSLSESDRAVLFPSALHLFHPEIGWAEQEATFDWTAHLELPAEKIRTIIQPENSVFIPQQIKSFQIKAVPPEELIKNLEENLLPGREKMPDDPLDILEKGRLALYRKLFEKPDDKDAETGRTGLMNALNSFAKSMSDKGEDWSDNLQEDFEQLHKRNQKQLEKLLDWLKKNPEEALKYAIPLDDNHSSRGGRAGGDFMLSKQWGNLSLFGRQLSRGGGGSYDNGDDYYRLQQQYEQTAKDLIAKKQYKKAAFVYLKLLKNNYRAAQTLEDGQLYQEAALIYLKHANDKFRAAQCYEKGNMFREAIELYEEMNMFELVGDLYMKLQDREHAAVYYEKTVDQFKAQYKYMEASGIYKNKLQDLTKAQAVLLKGWEEARSGHKCLNQYFSNIPDLKKLKDEIDFVYHNKVDGSNREIFLKVIKKEYKKKNELSEDLREMGYEIIATQAIKNPRIVSELTEFNPRDKEIKKDTFRFNKVRQ